MSVIFAALHFLDIHRIIPALLLACFAAWAGKNKTFQKAFQGRLGRNRGLLVLLLSGVLLSVGCETEDGKVIPSGCQELFLVNTYIGSVTKVSRALVGIPQNASAPLSSTPYLVFEGNRTLLGAPIDSQGNIYGVGLQRQSDCSLTEFILANYNLATSTFSVNNTIPNYQNTLHLLALLKTTAGKFSNGCKDSSLGVSSNGAVVLGLTKDKSQYIAAGINPIQSTLVAGTVNLSNGSISETTISSVPAPVSVATADVNGDGYKDLLVAGIANTNTLAGAVYVFLSNGDGTFKSPATYAAGQATGALTVDDVNNDGKLDLVATGYYQGQTTNGVQTLLGNGDGTFQAAVSSPLVGASYIAAADFNGDGKKDLVLSNGAIALGHGDGTFAAPAFTLPIPAGTATVGGTIGAPAVGDFNNDGKLDVAVSVPSGPFVSIFFGKGDGTFTTGKSYAAIGDSPDLAVADFDGDGNLDLLQGSASSGQYGPSDSTHTGLMNILMGNGDGTFQAAPSYPDTVLPNNTNGPIQAAAFAAGDFNGDGKIDLLGTTVTTSTSKGLLLLAGDGAGNFTPGASTGSSSPTVIAAADMNGDGKLDAVIADNLTSVGVALGNGNGGFQAVVDYPLQNSASNIVSLITGDFNGDGKPDVLVTANNQPIDNGTAVYLLLNHGDGTLQAATAIDTPATSPVGLTAGDLNGDGALDFVITTASNPANSTAGSMLVYLGKGDGTFHGAASYGPGFNPGPLAMADMNKDGRADVVVGSTDQNYSQGTVSVYLSKSDGTLQTPHQLTTTDAAFTSMTTADINGDSNPDVVMGQNLASVALGNGDGTLQAAYSVGVGTVAQSITALDINGDKRPDLLFVSGTSLDTLLNLYGTATSGAATSTSLSISPNPAAAGQAVTFTAEVSSSSGTPAGTVAFQNGGTQLGTGSLNASGQATYTTSSLAAGFYSVTAAYGGDSNFMASTSSAVALTVTGAGVTPDFTLSASPDILTVTAGQSGTLTLTATPQNGFNQEISFACTGLPSNAACSFSPATVMPSGAAATTTMTVTTTAPSSSKIGGAFPLAGGGTALAFCVLLLRRKKLLHYHTGLGLVALLLIAIGSTAIGCGGKKSSSGGGSTPAGTSTVTVTATSGTGTTALSHQATLTLTVQ